MNAFIQLEPFTEADIPRLLTWVNTPDLLFQWTGTVFPFPLTQKHFQQHLRLAEKHDTEMRIYKAIDKSTGEIIGHGELARIDLYNASTRLTRILIGPDNKRGLGFGTALVRELLRIAFDDLHLHRVSLNVFDFNSAAIRCYERLGFKNEGILRDARKFNGRFWDVYLMSLLETEFDRGMSTNR